MTGARSTRPVSAAIPAEARKTPDGYIVGGVSDVWRYPVKSMLGERLLAAMITPSGVVGDRAWAVRECATGRIASAKRFPRLLECRATYLTGPSPDGRGRLRIELPHGIAVDPEDRERTSSALSALLGAAVQLDHRDELGGDGAAASGEYELLTVGSFFEIGPVMLLASGSIAHLNALERSRSHMEQRRFRPNLHVVSDPVWTGFVEDAWIDRTLVVGELRCTRIVPTLWCVAATLAREELPREPRVLRAIVEHHAGYLGAYATTTASATVEVGDRVLLEA
jgi:uncharacterized protein